MPSDWSIYSAAVQNWVPRRRPYIARTATLHFPDSGRDSRALAWLMRQVEDGLAVQLEPQSPSLRRQRLVYVSSDPDLDAVGIAALGRALEHLGGIAAVAGWTLRLPGICQSAELITFLVPIRRLATGVGRAAHSKR
jgi:hypothetical protein